MIDTALLDEDRRGDSVLSDSESLQLTGLYRALVCPDCKTPAGEMEQTGCTSEMIAHRGLERRPYLRGYGRQVLACKCGARLTWYDLLEIRMLEFQRCGFG